MFCMVSEVEGRRQHKNKEENNKKKGVRVVDSRGLQVVDNSEENIRIRG